MPHASVRLVALAMVFPAATLLAQDLGADVRHFRIGVGLGATIPNGYTVTGPDEIGPHVQLSGIWTQSARLAIRSDVRAQMLSGAAAVPSCVPGAVCRGYALHPDQVYSATASAEVRPFSSARRLFGMVGAGAYHARGPEATNFGTTGGMLGGVGLDLSGTSRSGFVLDVQYHYLPNAFGMLTGMLTPSIAYRF